MNKISITHSELKKKVDDGTFSLRLTPGESYVFSIVKSEYLLDVIQYSSMMFNHDSAMACLDEEGHLVGGPHQGTETFDQYRTASIDYSRAGGGTSCIQTIGINRVE